MRTLTITTAFMICIAGTAFAQNVRSVRDMVAEMKTTHGKTYDECQAIATSLGYRITDDEADGRPVAMFIQGCIMGRKS